MSMCNKISYERGLEYYKGGRVNKVEIIGDKLKAIVAGTYNYEVTVKLDNGIMAGQLIFLLSKILRYVISKREISWKVQKYTGLYQRQLPKKWIVWMIRMDTMEGNSVMLYKILQSV